MTEEFVHKNKLQEYTQRSAIALPIYNTVNQGPPHAPQFRSNVIVDGAIFTSNFTFTNKKAAEQHAAKCALEAIKSFIKNNGVSLIPKSNLIFKSILNEYAVKMNLKLPTYETSRGPGEIPAFFSSVSFDNKTFKGDFGKSKREAEQIGARTVIEFILGTSDTGTLLMHIIKSKVKLYAAIAEGNISISQIENPVIIEPIIQESSIKKLESQLPPNCDISTSLQLCYSVPPPIRTLSNTAAVHSVPSRAMEHLHKQYSDFISDEKPCQIPGGGRIAGRSTSATSNHDYIEPHVNEISSTDLGNHSTQFEADASKKSSKRKKQKKGSGFLSDERPSQIPDGGVVIGTPTSAISKTYYGEPHISKLPSNDSGIHSNQSQANGRKKRKRSVRKNKGKSSQEGSQVDTVPAAETSAPQ